MIDIGVTMFLYGDDYGRDPRAFIGWANDTKLVFFYAMLAAAGKVIIEKSCGGKNLFFAPENMKKGPS
jgi:hypothetical protein